MRNKRAEYFPGTIGDAASQEFDNDLVVEVPHSWHAIDVLNVDTHPLRCAFGLAAKP
ncbi:hypothetical protein [Roseobacter sp. EG26]|uniref:hypothetical protein n=1 Tax=Roseobacter sp. EG26 TaxID=3412477 RepID=UPI003CE48C79